MEHIRFNVFFLLQIYMAFKRISGDDRGLIERTISLLTLTDGMLMVYDRSNAVVIEATAAAEIDNLAGIVRGAYTTADTTVLLEPIIKGDQYEVGTLNNSDATHNYQRMIWGTGHTANNTGTDVAGDTGLFMQVSTLGATTDKKIIGEFTTGSVGD